MKTVSARADWPLRTVTATAASTSALAFVLAIAGVIEMPFTINAIALPSMALIVALSVWAGRVHRTAFMRRLWVGLIAGALATIAYDLLRWVILVTVPWDFDPFRAHRNFGALIMSTSPHATSALVAGWVYHLWNGLSFAVMYTMMAGGARWRWAFLWAMALETATVITYPTAFGMRRSDLPFVTVSFLGHAVYGTTLGVLARNWLHGSREFEPGLRLARPTLATGFS